MKAHKKGHKKAHKRPGQKHDLVGGMMKWFKKKLVGGRKWHLIKKHNGLCKCTQHPRGRIIVSKHDHESDCENQRNGC